MLFFLHSAPSEMGSVSETDSEWNILQSGMVEIGVANMKKQISAGMYQQRRSLKTRARQTGYEVPLITDLRAYFFVVFFLFSRIYTVVPFFRWVFLFVLCFFLFFFSYSFFVFLIRFSFFVFVFRFFLFDFWFLVFFFQFVIRMRSFWTRTTTTNPARSSTWLSRTRAAAPSPGPCWICWWSRPFLIPLLSTCFGLWFSGVPRWSWRRFWRKARVRAVFCKFLPQKKYVIRLEKGEYFDFFRFDWRNKYFQTGGP